MPESDNSNPLSNQIVAHRTRGHGFRLAFDCPVAFAHDVSHVLFEPDPAGARAMVASNPNPAHIQVVPCLLGEADRSGVLHVAADPEASSEREPLPLPPLFEERVFNGEIGGALVRNLRYDARTEPVRAVRDQAVEVRALDGLLARGELPLAAPPDFLCIEAPGTEHETIEGARECLRASVLAVTMQAAFVPRYQGQRLFGELHAELHGLGLAFAGFTDIQEASARRLPVGLRGYEAPVSARCLYLRPAAALLTLYPDAGQRYAKASKLAFIALVFGQLAHALEALDVAEASGAGTQAKAALAQRSYGRCLARLRTLTQAWPADFLHESAPSAALGVARRSEELAGRAQRATHARPGWIQTKAAGAARRLQRTWITLMGGVPPAVNAEVPSASLPAPTTALEDFLLLNGFWSVAERVRHRRALAHAYIRRADGSP